MTIKEAIFVSYNEQQAKVEIPDQNVHMSELMKMTKKQKFGIFVFLGDFSLDCINLADKTMTDNQFQG